MTFGADFHSDTGLWVGRCNECGVRLGEKRAHSHGYSIVPTSLDELAHAMAVHADAHDRARVR